MKLIKTRISIKPIRENIILTKKSKTALDTFIGETFDIDGSYKTTDHQPQPSKSNCMYCPYKDKKDLCNKSILT